MRFEFVWIFNVLSIFFLLIRFFVRMLKFDEIR